MNDSMNDQPIDFTPLDPTRETARFDAVAGAISRDAMQARAYRAATRYDVFAQLTRWSRPALIAAAVVVAAAAASLMRSRNAAPARISVASGTDVLGIPQPLMELLRSSRTPSLTQIDQALASVDGAGR